MKPLNQFTSTVPSSGIRLIFEMANTMDDCIRFEIGQPDFETPAHITEAIAKASRDGYTKYVSNYGIPELREAIAQKVTEQNGFHAGPENIIVSAGGLCSLFISFLIFAEPGDEVLIPDPSWPNYLMQMACLGTKGVPYPLDPDNGFRIDFDKLESLVTPKTKVILVNSPGNPTGVVFPREDMERINEFARRHDLYIVSDEVYENIIYDGDHISNGMYDEDGRTAVIFSFSKAYAMTGLRVGYVVCDEKIAERIAKIHEAVISCATSVVQKGALAALQGPQDIITDMVKDYKARRDALVSVLKRKNLFKYNPGGAFYTMVDISSTGMNSTDFALALLKERNVAVAPGETFGKYANSYVRICFSNNRERIVEGTEILCDFIHERSK